MLLTHSKKTWFLLIACCLLLLISACGNMPSSQLVQTQQTSTAPPPTSIAAGSLLTSSCPVPRAVMPALSAGTHPNIVYLSERGGLQTAMTAAQLIRYDTITKSKTILLSFAQSGEVIYDAHISTDGQWILFLTSSFSQSQAQLHLIRVDGQLLQTLFCAPAFEIGSIQWSPDARQVAFSVSGTNGHVSAIQLLDLTTTHQEVFPVSNYRPYAWLDNTRLYIIRTQGNLLTSPLNLSFLDTSKGNTTSFTPIASANALCGTFEKSSDGTQLFTGSCTPVDGTGCRGPATQGPSTLNVRPATGGPAKTIYHSQNQAVMIFHLISSQTLLMYIGNTSGDLSQNGLWKINADGSGLTRLTTVVGRACQDLGYRALYPQILSGGQYYAQRMVDSTSANESLLVGRLNGDAPTVFERKDTREGVLILVGVVMH